MKIVIIGPAHPYRGGIAALNDRLAIELSNMGHETKLISFKLQYPSFLFPGKTQFSDSPKPNGLNILNLINSINPINWILTGVKVRKLDADLILVRYWLPFMGPSTGTVCRISKNNTNKIIAITDNILPHEKRPGDLIFTKYFAGSVDAFLAMSECVFQDLDLFRKTKPKRISPHPIYDHYGEILQREEALKLINLDQEYRYLLFFGFIRDYKGLDLLLEAFSKIDYIKHKLKLIIAGEFYSDEEKYTDLIEKLQLRDRIILKTDYIPDKEVNRYFSAADIITQPYKTATQSGVTQIGYHFNKPMLVTNVGGLSEIIDHDKGGYVVEPDSDHIAIALTNFFESNRLESMQKHVLIAKERFSWSYFSNSIMKIYTDLKQNERK